MGGPAPSGRGETPSKGGDYMKYILVPLFFLFVSRICAQEELKPESFSGAMVYSGTEGSLLKLEIPMEVYKGLRRPDLGDIRIFDARGNPVPFMIRDKPKEYFTPPPEDVPFFLWEGGKENSFPLNTDIEINTSGGVVRIKNQNAVSEKPPVYLVDCSLLKHTPSGLKVGTKTQMNFNTPVTIHTSADLSEWKLFEKRQVLAFFGGRAQDTLELPGNTLFRYLLLSFTREAPPPLSITAFFIQQEKPGEYHELTIRGKKSPDGKKIQYETSAFIPAESINFILEEADSIPVVIKNRITGDEEWKTVTKGAVYRYNSAAGLVKNEAFKISSLGDYSSAPFWEMEASGELPFNTVPDMVLSWIPKEIIFPARGSGPWTLAYSKSDCPRFAGGFLPSLIEEELEPAFFTGEKRYEETNLVAAKEKNYKVYILWAFLGAAALVLTILAISIARSICRKQ